MARDGDYIVQLLWDDDSEYLATYTSNKAIAIRTAQSLLSDLFCEVTRARIITVDGELVWSSESNYKERPKS